MAKVVVKIEYLGCYNREPEFQECDSKADAALFIETCRSWGIGIKSCEIVNDTGKKFEKKMSRNLK